MGWQVGRHGDREGFTPFGTQWEVGMFWNGSRKKKGVSRKHVELKRVRKSLSCHPPPVWSM